MGVLTQLSDEQLSLARENMLNSDPVSGDIQEALMNRITALEKRVMELEKHDRESV